MKMISKSFVPSFLFFILIIVFSCDSASVNQRIENKYTIKFDNANHGIAPSPLFGVKGEIITLPQALTESGWKFVCWLDGTTEYDAGASYTVTRNVTLKAKWNKIYTITFDNDGHGVAPNPMFGSKGEIIILPQALTSEEYTFVNWTDGTTDYDAGASYTITGNVTLKAVWSIIPVEQMLAGIKPIDIIGTQTLPTFTAPITDHLYLASSSENKTGELAGQIENASKFQWYSGTEGNKWQKISGKTARSLQITVEQGTTYYILEAKSADGNSIAYTNICTVICGGDKTANIGKILYLDNSVADDYKSNSTPIGIIFDVDAEGNPSKIVNLNQQENTAWCTNSAEGCSKNFETSYSDGSGNWKVISDNISDEGTIGNYPAFDYCNSLIDGGKTWYVPSRDEASAIYFNQDKINDSIRKLKMNDVVATDIKTNGWFLTSSQYSDVEKIWQVSLDYGSQSYNDKSMEYIVRGVAKL